MSGKATYCVRCKRKTGNKNPRPYTAKNGRKMTMSTCAVCGGKKSTIGGFLPAAAIPFIAPVVGSIGARYAGKALDSLGLGIGKGRGRGLTPYGMKRGGGRKKSTRGRGKKGGSLFGLPTPIGLASKFLM